MTSILIIEDDESLRTGISEILKSEGYNTIESHDGMDALKKTEEVVPDLVISDILMPGLDGYSILSMFQSNPSTSSVPFIFLTAKVEDNDIRNGMNCGADDYITKPFNYTDLIKSIKIRLNKKRQQEEKINEFSFNISRSLPHELRTPLVSILGFSSLLIDDFNSFDNNEILKIINRIKLSGKRLHNTIEKFLLYTEFNYFLKDKGDTSSFINSYTEITQVTINKLIEEKHEKYKRDDDFYLQIIECMVKILEDHFKFIISELIENSLKFSKPGSIIGIITGIEDNIYNIRIVDYGKGFTPEQIYNIIPFEQFDKNFYQQEGNGLGLAIVKRLVEIYHGEFNIDSKRDLYTMIEIKLPIKLQETN